MKIGAAHKWSLFFAFGWFAFAAPRAFGPNAPAAWQDQNIYQIVTDRFFNGDITNDNAEGNYNASAGQGVHGGDFKGIEQKLDYIKALGATAIWISPVVQNGNGDYHGYAGRDFYKTAPHFGSLDDLKHLIDTAHAKGLLVIDDVVVNHGAQLLNSNDSGYPNFRTSPDYNLFYRDNAKRYAAPFDPASNHALGELFHGNGFIQNFNDTTQLERGSLEGLDDFRTESGYVQTQMVNIYNFWMDQGFDAFRVDTVKHVEHAFWNVWSPQIRQHASDLGRPAFFMFGEVYDASDAKVASYIGGSELNSALDYPLYFSINGVFARANSNTKQIEDHYHAIDSIYDSAARNALVTFLDNHDQARFLNSANGNNNVTRLNVALAFLYSARGIPCLYYGTEQAFNGGADPSNREDMFAGQFETGPSAGDNFNETHPLFQFVAKLNNLRRLYPALRTGAHVNLWNDPSGPGLFAYSRVLGGQEIFVALNTGAISQALPSRPTTYAPGTLLVNLLEPNDVIAITPDGQTPSLSVAPTTAKLYIARSQLLPLDPVVISIAPTHDKTNVPTPSKIVIAFSKAMDTASVEAGFSTTPVIAGAFSWSAAHDQLTFQAAGGLPELSMIAVRINNTSAAADGTFLHAPFEARFSTAAKTVQDVTPPTISITRPSAGATITSRIDLNGEARDDTGVVRIEFQLDRGNWIPINYAAPGGKNFSWGHPFWLDGYLNGAHVVSARAYDAAGNVSPTVSVPFRTNFVPGGFDEALFAYGSSGWGIRTCDGTFWYSDTPYNENFYYGGDGFIDGNTASSSAPIANACADDQRLYQQERYSSAGSDFHYRFNCPPGVYDVTLLDAETFMTGPNQRRFDVYMQGQKVLQNFDIFLAAGGANRAWSQTFTVTVSNALLDVAFRPVFDNARISGVHVKKVADVYSDADGIPDWWRLAMFDHATGSADDGSRASDDPDHDGRTNLEEYLANTNPFDPSSWLHITGARNSGAYHIIKFVPTPNRNFQLQVASDPRSPVWMNVGNPIQGYGYEFEIVDYDGASRGPQAFYRIIVAP